MEREFSAGSVWERISYGVDSVPSLFNMSWATRWLTKLSSASRSQETARVPQRRRNRPRDGGRGGRMVACCYRCRALFVAEGVINHSFEDFPYDRITTVTLSRGLAFGKIVI